MRRVFLLLELAVLFVAVPVLMAFSVIPLRPVAVLLIAMAFMLRFLISDPEFDRGALINWAGFRRFWRALTLRCLGLLLVLGAGVVVFAPELLFDLVKRTPRLWAGIVLLYPLLSVYPQELIYRAFFFHRYQELFPRPAILLGASALLFGFVHIIFGNWVSILLSTPGGLLFSLTYWRSRSLLLTAAEHAIFGDFLFTIGLGHYFYRGMS